MTDFEQRYAAARKAVIARDLARLNPMQRQGAMTTEGPLLLLAGAGSGKTTVLIQRVYNLLTYGRGSDSDEVPDWATEEDLAFLEQFPERPSEAEAERAHRLCAVAVPRPWEIIAITFTNKAAGELKERLAARLGPAANDVWASTFHSACVRILRRDIDRIGFDKDFTIYDTDDAKRVVKDILKEQNLDEKTFPIRSVLSAISASKDRYEGPEVFRKKAEAANDWRIYRFRGANIENILNFEKQYKDARVIRLEQNYRSTQHILDAANAVIKNNAGRKGKTLWTDNGSGDTVTVKTNFNEGDEANFVAGDILMGVNRGRNFRDTAILYRMNAQSNALEYALKRNAIPYKVVGGMKFFDRAEVKDMLAYLCVLNNPMDDLRLRRIINTPARGIGATTMDKVAELAAEQGASLYEIVRNADLFPALKTASAKLVKFADLIDNLRKAGGTLALPEFYDEVLNQTGYVKALEDKNDMESRGRIENVQELKSNILGFLEQDPEDATLSGFLNEIALYTDLDSVEADDNCVTMMTIHSAKGLEFPVVYVVGMEEGIFPGSSAMYDEEELEEERRLCYVAMTRAREKLVMTNARQRMLYGRTSANKASRFLEEIPEEDMHWESKPEPRFGAANEEGFGGSRWDDTMGGSSYGGYGAQRSAGGYGSAGTGRSGGYVSGGVHTYKSAKPAPQTLRTSSRGSAPAAPAVELLQLHPGDQVEHTAFGKGSVVSVKPMGGDALAEVAFESGTKKLMLKSAGKHMKKL